MPAKLDLFKSLKSEYAAKAAPALVETTPGSYLSITGDGVPGGETFSDRVGALYAVAYTTKMRHKRDTGVDYTVAKLECLWHGLPETRDATTGWQWQLLIRVPEFITAEHRDESVAALLAKKKPATVNDVTLEHLHEGTCVQMLHVGPYEDEPTSFAVMREFAEAEGRQAVGPPHEIYISDPRRVEPAKLKTILRQAVE